MNVLKTGTDRMPDGLSPRLDTLDWVSDDCYQLLDCRVRVRSTGTEIAAQVRRLMRSFPLCPGYERAADLTLSLVLARPSRDPRRRPLHLVYRDGDRVGCAAHPWQLFRLLEWQLDVFLAEEVRHRYLVHAGAIARQGKGIILPGLSGNGKSSLTMALLLRGCHYLSDELAVIDPASGELSAFPKPFSLKDPSLFPDLADRKDLWFGPAAWRPERARRRARGYEPVWYVHPEDVRAQAIGDGSFPIRHVIFPKYCSDATPQLRPLSPGQAMRKLIENSVNYHQLGQGGLHLLAALVEEAQCFSLTANGLEATAELITHALS